MKFKFLYSIFALAIIAFVFSSSSGGRATVANSGNIGAPGDPGTTCINCHGTGTFGGNTTVLNVYEQGTTNLVTQYQGGVTYDVEVAISVATGTPAGYGFQMTVLEDGGNTMAGSFANPSANSQLVTLGSGRTYHEHGVGDGITTPPLYSPTGTFTTEWTAPAAGTGNITFYAGGNAVNGNGSNGDDDAALITQSMTEMVCAPDLHLVGIFDGPLTGGEPKVLEFAVTNNITDLSQYGFGVANNGLGTDGVEWNFPADPASAGDTIKVALGSATNFANYFGCSPDYTAPISLGFNGDDAIEVFCGAAVIDIYGDINVDGSGTPWDYLDSWVKRTAGGPDGSTFVIGNWNIQPINTNDGQANNATATTPFPISNCAPSACSVDMITAANISACNLADNTYTVDITVTYTSPPASGTLDINGQSFTITTSPQTETLTLASTGAATDVTATFSADPLCTLTMTGLYTAPAACVSSPIQIAGVIDGPLTGGHPKALELHITTAIADMSLYGIASVTNGNPSPGQEYTFPAVSANPGDCIWVAADSTGFADFFGFNADYITGVMGVNGDDPIELYCNGNVVDVFGTVGTDGTGQPWEYMDGWAVRNTGMMNNNGSFNDANWTFSGPNALDLETSNATAATPYPLTCTVSCSASLVFTSTADDITDASDTQSAQNDITASNVITFTAGANMVEYDAGVEVVMMPGFQAVAGGTSHYRAYIMGCTPKTNTNENNNSLENNMVMDVYPNPAANEVQILVEILQSGNVKLELYDLQGRLINSIFDQNLEAQNQYNVGFDVSNLPSGMYIVRLVNETGDSQVSRLSVQH